MRLKRLRALSIQLQKRESNCRCKADSTVDIYVLPKITPFTQIYQIFNILTSFFNIQFSTIFIPGTSCMGMSM